MVGAVEQAADRGVGAQAVKALGADEDKRENDGANATDAARSPPPRPATVADDGDCLHDRSRPRSGQLHSNSAMASHDMSALTVDRTPAPAASMPPFPSGSCSTGWSRSPAANCSSGQPW
jgi:hypothetical protein